MKPTPLTTDQRLMLALVVLVTSAALWAVFAPVDQIVRAEGRIIAAGRADGKTVTVSDVSALTKANGTGDWNNYNLTTVGSMTTTANITKKGVSLAGITASSKTYDGNTSATVVTTHAVFNGQIAGDELIVSSAGSFSDKNVAIGKTVNLSNTLGGADLGNYTVNDQASTTAEISKKAISLSGITATSKIYDGTTSADVAATNAVFNGQIAGDELTVSSAGTFSDKNVAIGKTVNLSNTLGGADLGNYTVADQTSTTAEISKKAINLSGITATSKIYDGTTLATVATTNAVFTGQIAGDELTVSSAGTFSDKNVGTGKTVNLNNTLGGADLGNYTVADQTSTTANVTAKAITISGITADYKVYDATTAATVNTANATGWISGDAVTVAATGVFDNKNVGTGKTVALTTTAIGGIDASNYSITNQTSTTANVTAKAITISGITADHKVYDATTAATVNTANATGWISGDVVTVAATGVFDNKNVGTGKTVSVAGISLLGADAANYSLQYTTASTTANVTAKVLQASGAVADKVYDGTRQASLADLSGSGVLAGDTVLYQAGSALFDGKDVLRDASGRVLARSVTVSDLSLLGADATNYSLSSNSFTAIAKITPKLLGVSGTRVANKAQDGNTQAEVQMGSLSGLVAGEQLQTQALASFDSATAGSNKPVMVRYRLANGADGSLASNYELKDQVLTASILVRSGGNPVQALKAPLDGAAVGTSAATATLVQTESRGLCSSAAPENCQCHPTSVAGMEICMPGLNKPQPTTPPRSRAWVQARGL